MGTNIELTNIAGQITLITINRPDAANALSRALLNELNDCLDELNQEKRLNCVIFTGAGTKAFCAGADLKERRNMTDAEVIETVQLIGSTFDKIAALEMPTIAAVNGAAYGGGLELALACDIRFIAEQAKLGLTETSLAILPGAGGTQRLPRLIGIGQAKKMIFSAKPIGAAEAIRLGLAGDMATSDNLLNKAIELAKTISKNGPLALRLAKKAINEGMETTLTNGLEMEHAYYKQIIPTADRLEGLQAFKEKRPPKYQGN